MSGTFHLAGNQIIQQPAPQQSFQIIGAPSSNPLLGQTSAILGQPQLIATAQNGQQTLITNQGGQHQLITNQNGQSQLIATNQGGQPQLITNQNGQTQLLISSPQQFQHQQQQQQPQPTQANSVPVQQQIVQFVLPNGQVVQTMQPQQHNLVAQPTIQLQQQPPQITVPIQAGGQQGPATILAPNLSLSGQTFISNPQQTPTLQANIIGHSTPTVPTVFENLAQQPQTPTLTGQVLLHSPTMQPSTVVLRNNNTTSTPTLLIPSSMPGQNQQHSGSSVNSTTMVVLTPSMSTTSMDGSTTTTTTVNTIMPSVKGEQKSTKKTPPQIPASLAEKIMGTSIKPQQSMVNSQTSTSSSSSSSQITGVTMSEKTTSPLMMVDSKASSSSSSSSSSPQPTDNNNKNRFSPVNNNEIATQTSIEYKEEEEEGVEGEVGRPSRPASTSSSGSLHIAETDEAINDDEFDDSDTESDTTEVNSEETIVEGDDNIKTPDTNQVTSSNDANTQSQTGVQGNCQSPFVPNFTDTEDEEEEETEQVGCTDIETGAMKLVHKNGLTKEAYDLINNRILNSDDENANSSESRGSPFCEEVSNFNEKSNEANSTVQLTHSSTCSSPASMLSEGADISTQNGLVPTSRCESFAYLF